MQDAFSTAHVLRLFSYFRQAERSVHYALSCPSQWREFVAYYNSDKQDCIRRLIHRLHQAGARESHVPPRESFHRSTFRAILWSLARLIVNRARASWLFSAEELSFFSATFQLLLRTLSLTDHPGLGPLFELRMDCLQAQVLIKEKLIGVRGLRRAETVEHFNQSDYVQGIAIEDLCGEDMLTEER